MSSTFLGNLVLQMRAMNESTVVLDVDGKPVQIELVPAPKPSAAQCAACRAELRLWTAILPQQPPGRN